MKKYDNERILVISDTHFPYSHRDTLPFLEAVKNKYKPDRVVHVGDELDKHALSFHEKDPDLYSAGQELEKGLDDMHLLYTMFPRVDVMESNHGSRAFRAAKAAGIPKRYLKAYKDVLEAPDGWRWHESLTLTVPGDRRVYFHHGVSADVAKVAREYGMCTVSGHFHTTAAIQYCSTPTALLWGMCVGCSIDPHSPAFSYSLKNLKRPIICHGLIENGFPRLLPIQLNKAGRWTGVVP